jgi:hypothetical protein
MSFLQSQHKYFFTFYKNKEMISDTITVQQTDWVSVPSSLLEWFVDMYHQMTVLYEKIDHTIAIKNLKSGKTKSFNNINDLYNDLDN